MKSTPHTNQTLATDSQTRGATSVTELRTVSHAYGSLSVLEDVSLAFDAGELVAVVGPNGSGKSTFLRLLAGVTHPTEGTVVRGSDSADTEVTVGYLPQHLHPRDEFSVIETLDYYASLVDEGRDPTEVVEFVGLEHVADRRIGALSGGMRRLLGVGIAVVGDPDLVVLDEPTSGLDRTMTRRVFTACLDVATAGPAVVLASHDLSTVERMADRVVFIDGGRVEYDGPPSGFGDETASFVDAYDERVETDANTTVRGGRR